MIRATLPKLREWSKDPAISTIILRGTGDKAFCAGGDIKAVVEDAAGGPNAYSVAVDGEAPVRRSVRIGKGTLSDRFFREEYELDYAIHQSPKNTIALMDGHVIGGGVGLSMPARFRVCTERSQFAFPETNIGMIPDVGATYFLPRLHSSTPYLGVFIALTNGRLRGADLRQTRIATHFVHSDLLTPLYNALVSMKHPASASEVQAVLDRFERKSGFKPGSHSLAEVEARIDKLFAADSLAQIVNNLEAAAKGGDVWAREQLELIHKFSPTSAAIVVRQLRLGAASTFRMKDSYALEYRLVQHLFQDLDVYEGVSALLIDKKRKARWNPASYKDVTDSRLDWYFSPLSPDLEINLAD
jgi:enoyl-CoA hydratase/carnithine racemase